MAWRPGVDSRKARSFGLSLSKAFDKDNADSLDFLLSDEDKAAIVQLHVDGIKAYVDSCSEDEG